MKAMSASAARLYLWLHIGQLPLDAFQKTQFEANQIVIDAHPVTRVLPVLGFEVLSFEWVGPWCLRVCCRHDGDYIGCLLLI
jgi:hypothetical protein